MPNIIEITNIAAPELDPYVRLTEAQLKNRLHPEDGLFIAESPKVIGYALDAGYVPISLLMEREWNGERLGIAINFSAGEAGRIEVGPCKIACDLETGSDAATLDARDDGTWLTLPGYGIAIMEF